MVYIKGNWLVIPKISKSSPRKCLNSEQYLIFGHMVFIYSVIRFESNVLVSNHPVSNFDNSNLQKIMKYSNAEFHDLGWDELIVHN